MNANDADLRQAFLTSNSVFASLSIRDALDIFFSARDNFKKSDEFPKFAHIMRGCETANSHFARIYKAAAKTSTKNTSPSCCLRAILYRRALADPAIHQAKVYHAQD